MPLYVAVILESCQKNTTLRFNSSLLDDLHLKSKRVIKLKYVKMIMVRFHHRWDAAKAVLKGKIIAVTSRKGYIKELDMKNQLTLLEGC